VRDARGWPQPASAHAAVLRISAGNVRAALGVLPLGVAPLRALPKLCVRCTKKNAPSIATRGVSLQPPIRIIESTPRTVNQTTHEVPIIKTRFTYHDEQQQQHTLRK
jgi:hypothetical protein